MAYDAILSVLDLKCQHEHELPKIARLAKKSYVLHPVLYQVSENVIGRSRVLLLQDLILKLCTYKILE